jgi:hypothetical protein
MIYPYLVVNTRLALETVHPAGELLAWLPRSEAVADGDAVAARELGGGHRPFASRLQFLNFQRRVCRCDN